MMDKELTQQIELVLSRHLEWLSSELRGFVVENNLKGNLISHCSSNRYGRISASISYFPHNDPAEESIVFSLSSSINPRTQKVDFLVDIYWSDGSQIQDLMEYTDIAVDKALLQIDLMIEQSRSEWLLEIKKQISIDPEPRYQER